MFPFRSFLYVRDKSTHEILKSISHEVSLGCVGKIIRVASAPLWLKTPSLFSFKLRYAVSTKLKGINQTAITNFIIAIPNHGKNES